MTPTPDPSRILPGAEPGSWQGGPNGALVLHGFTGSPQSMRPLAEAFAAAGFTVEMPLLPGHGTDVKDMIPTTFTDWSGAAEAAYTQLAGRCDKVVVAGLSMGGTLTCWLASRHPEIAGIVVVNPAVEPPAESFLEIFQGSIDAGLEVIPGIGNDVADPDVTELAYPETPLAAGLSMFGAINDLAERLGDIRCPVLLLNSPQDHVVPPSNADYLAERVGGPIERVSLDRSFHVATIDYDKDEIAKRAVAFAEKVTAS
jgi:carboxylesterase